MCLDKQSNPYSTQLPGTSFIFLKREYRTTSNNNNVTIERKKFTKTEKQYLRGIIHNLSHQRLTDQEIVDYLQREKKIDISRSTATKIRNQVVEEAGDGYLELREFG